MTGKLYLIPTFLGNPDSGLVPEAHKKIIHGLKHFVAEKEKSARAFLKAVDSPVNQDDFYFIPLDKRTTEEEILEAVNLCLDGVDVGLLSEAGSPCIADPGASVVNKARKNGIKIVPLHGLSSLLMALMASGFNGQSFRFHGYLPHDKKKRLHIIRDMERDAHRGETQIFIETPYRNNPLLDELLGSCRPETHLCVAADLSTETEEILCMRVAKWNQNKVDLNKRPAVFLIGRPK